MAGVGQGVGLLASCCCGCCCPKPARSGACCLFPAPRALPWLLETSPHTVALPAGCVVSIGFSPRLFHLPKKGGSGGAGGEVEVEESLSSVFALGSQDKRISGEQSHLKGCQAVPGLPLLLACCL